MQTITIAIPDNVNARDARTFVLQKMHEAGFLSPDQAAQTLDESDEEDVEVAPDSDSYFTSELREQIARNRKRLEEEYAKNPPKRSHEELLQLLLNMSVADEETIKRQDEVREHMRQWKSPW